MKKWSEQRAPRGSCLEKSQLVDRKQDLGIHLVLQHFDPLPTPSPLRLCVRSFQLERNASKCQGVKLETTLMSSNISCIFQVFYHERILFLSFKKLKLLFQNKKAVALSTVLWNTLQPSTFSWAPQWLIGASSNVKWRNHRVVVDLRNHGKSSLLLAWLLSRKFFWGFHRSVPFSIFKPLTHSTLLGWCLRKIS